MRSFPREVLSGGTTIRHMCSEDEVCPSGQDEACHWERVRMLAWLGVTLGPHSASVTTFLKLETSDEPGFW